MNQFCNNSCSRALGGSHHGEGQCWAPIAVEDLHCIVNLHEEAEGMETHPNGSISQNSSLVKRPSMLQLESAHVRMVSQEKWMGRCSCREKERYDEAVLCCPRGYIN